MSLFPDSSTLFPDKGVRTSRYFPVFEREHKKVSRYFPIFRPSDGSTSLCASAFAQEGDEGEVFVVDGEAEGVRPSASRAFSAVRSLPVQALTSAPCSSSRVTVSSEPASTPAMLAGVEVGAFYRPGLQA